jgi:hypothetical protein
LSDDPELGSYQASAVAPLGPADQQRLLCADGAAQRLALLESLLTEESDYLAARLGME